MSDSIAIGEVRAALGRVCGDRLGRPEELLAAAPGWLPAFRAGGTGQYPEAVEIWAAGLEKRFDGRPIAVCLEQSRGPLVYMLTKYPHLVLFPVHPTTAARYRETFAPSGAKSDPSDTACLLDLLLRHRERLRPQQPDTPETRLLHFLVEQRRRDVEDKTRESNRLTDCLKFYFPQVLVGSMTSPAPWWGLCWSVGRVCRNSNTRIRAR